MTKLSLYKILFKSAFSKTFIYAKPNAKQYTFQNLIFISLLIFTILGGYYFIGYAHVGAGFIELAIHPSIFITTIIGAILLSIYCVFMLSYNRQLFGSKTRNIIYFLFGKFFGLQYSDIANNFNSLYPIFEKNNNIQTLQNLMNTLDESEISAIKRHESLKDFHNTLKNFIKNPDKHIRKSFETLQKEYHQNESQDLRFFDKQTHQ